jgi:uroporphyrinogen-III synthase
MSTPASSRPVVWITRPQPGTNKTAASLERLGFEPVVLPLSEVVASDPQIAIRDALKAHAVAATSGNAIRLAPDNLVEALADKPVYTVGDVTMEDARARGFSTVRSASGDVDDLVELLVRSEKPGSSLVYLCGKRRTGDLEGKLSANGIKCLIAEVYQTDKVSHMTDRLHSEIRRYPPDAVLFHSAFSARLFMEAVPDAEIQAFDNAMFFAISRRVGNVLEGRFHDRLCISDAPTEAALLACLNSRIARTTR